MEQTVVRASVGNYDVKPPSLENSLHFLEHFGCVEKAFISAQDGVESTLFYHDVVALVSELVHIQSVGHDSLHQTPFFVQVGHLLDADLGDVHVVDVVPAVVVHVAAHHRVAAAELQDFRVLRHQVVDDGLETGEVLQPVEGLAGLSPVPLLPILGVSVVRHQLSNSTCFEINWWLFLRFLNSVKEVSNEGPQKFEGSFH